ncbi:MAG: N-acetylmuramidase family protein [Lachnospiraceae bacterium]|nr:N-acetylmuramidase family protein [Lachnospiraceae bacterium]
MADYDNSRYTYEQVLSGINYYMQDDLLRFSSGVKIMQGKLNTIGYSCGTPDGKFGFGTNAAVRNFQNAKGLTVDGKAGKRTLATLDATSSSSTGGINSYTSFKQKHGATIKFYANTYGIDENVLGGFILAESSGSGFVNGKVIIRFENHHFLTNSANRYKGVYFDYGSPKYTGHIYRKKENANWINCHQNQTQENDAFTFAISLNSAKAYESTSMGLAQIMGFNYKRCGYSSAQKMYDDFATGEKAQLEGFNKFIIYDPILLNACQNKNYYTMAYRYNGSGNADTYASKIEVAYTAYKNA